MCLILFALEAHPAYSLIVAANHVCAFKSSGVMTTTVVRSNPSASVVAAPRRVSRTQLSAG